MAVKYQRLGQGLVTWIVDVSDRCQKNESIRNRVEWARFSSLSRSSPGGSAGSFREQRLVIELKSRAKKEKNLRERLKK